MKQESAHQVVAETQPRDSKGHFIKKPVAPVSPSKKDSLHDTLNKMLNTGSAKQNEDDLLDVHVGNPLRRITLLLEEIKKQKAFSFSIKGSLGVVGVVFALSVFGVFGGGKILCNKGIQTKIGIIRTLNVKETTSTPIPLLSSFLDTFSPKETHPRIVLVRPDTTTINIPFYSKVDFTKYINTPALVTGNYDECSETLTVSDPKSVQIY